MKDNLNGNFRKNIRQEVDMRKEILKLQKAYENGTILEKDLSNNQKYYLEKLYDEQAIELNNKIEQKKRGLKIKENLINEYYNYIIKKI